MRSWCHIRWQRHPSTSRAHPPLAKIYDGFSSCRRAQITDIAQRRPDGADRLHLTQPHSTQEQCDHDHHINRQEIKPVPQLSARCRGSSTDCTRSSRRAGRRSGRSQSADRGSKHTQRLRRRSYGWWPYGRWLGWSESQPLRFELRPSKPFRSWPPLRP